jgi:hypothetical protein
MDQIRSVESARKAETENSEGAAGGGEEDEEEDGREEAR